MSNRHSRNSFLISVGAASLAACSKGAPGLLMPPVGSSQPTALDSQLGQELTQALAKYKSTTRQLPKLPVIYSVTVRGVTAVVEVDKWVPASPGGLPEVNDMRFVHVWYGIYNASSGAAAVPVRMIVSIREGRTVLQRSLSIQGPACDRIPMDAAATGLIDELGLASSAATPDPRQRINDTEGGACSSSTATRSVTLGIDDAGSAGQFGFGHLYFQINYADGSFTTVEAGPINSLLEPTNYFHDPNNPYSITLATGTSADQIGNDLLTAQYNYMVAGFLSYDPFSQNSNSYNMGIGTATGDFTPGQLSNDYSALQNMSGLDPWGDTMLDAAGVYSNASTSAGC